MVMMGKRWIGWGFGVLGVGLALFYWLDRDEGAAVEKVSHGTVLEENVPDTQAAVAGVTQRRALEAGDSIEDETQPRLLRHYGDADRSALNDLQLVEEVLQRFWLLFKDPDLLVVGSNEDVLRCLTGGNPERIAFVSPGNRYIDGEGRLLDRWGTPLFFHAESMTRIEVRSSGPDRRRFTEDDVVVVAGSGTRLKH